MHQKIHFCEIDLFWLLNYGNDLFIEMITQRFIALKNLKKVLVKCRRPYKSRKDC